MYRYRYTFNIGQCQFTKCNPFPAHCFEGTLRAGLQLHDTHKDAGVEDGRVVHLERIFLLMGRFLQEVTCWVVAFLRDLKLRES